MQARARAPRTGFLRFSANLVLIVIFSGYGDLASKMKIRDRDWPERMTKVDFGGPRQRPMTVIVATPATEVLKGFMNIEKSEYRRAWLAGYLRRVPGPAAGGRKRAASRGIK
ncbi:MAG: hypothetical protein K8H87_18245 [Pseudorhodoplanes sp.]|nr:hypothetical protein [Pseudorhodoplanes sp.]